MQPRNAPLSMFVCVFCFRLDEVLGCAYLLLAAVSNKVKKDPVKKTELSETGLGLRVSSILKRGKENGNES